MFNNKDEKKLEMLISILDLPKTYSKEIIEIAIYLSIFGWQGHTINERGYIQCLFCRRLVGLWNFANLNHPNNKLKDMTGTTEFSKRPWHNINLKRLNEILSKRKANEDIENSNKKMRIEEGDSSKLEKEEISSIENKENSNNNTQVNNENSVSSNNYDSKKNDNNEKVSQ